MLGVDIVGASEALDEVERVGLHVLKKRGWTDPAKLVDHLDDVVNLFPRNP